MNFSIKVTNINAGWLDMEVVLNGQKTLLTASYLDDALGNLSEATLRIAKGEKESDASFAEEPGEYSWRLKKINDKKIQVKILWFDDWKGIRQEEEIGKIILDFEILLITFVRKLIICLSEVENKYGLEGYAKKWGMHEFPLQNYNELRKVLPALK